MRKYSEFTAKNLLRPALVMGVPFIPLMVLIGIVLTITVLGPESQVTSLSAMGVAGVGYLMLRLMTRFCTPGWEQGFLFWIESKSKRKKTPIIWGDSSIPIQSPETLTENDQVVLKLALHERLKKLKPKTDLVLKFQLTTSGLRGYEKKSGDSEKIEPGHFYSLIQIPTHTTPLFWLETLSEIETGVTVYIRIQGISHHALKRRLELSRRRHLQTGGSLTDIDSEVTFSEASEVLQGISRGDDSAVELSVAIFSAEKLNLDPAQWKHEKNSALSFSSITAQRKLFHRSMIVRLHTACDLIPNLFDPALDTLSFLKTTRGYPLYFSPNDPRLEALHWLVVGASGSGKSFFTGVVLKRMCEAGFNASVLFLDHNRSFRRLVLSRKEPYLEPSSLLELKTNLHLVFNRLKSSGSITGVELSDLLITEKKEAASFLLQSIESFLRTRNSTFPIYLVLDECWNFLRDEPVLVQRAFREFRKLNGGVIAITQSLSDFVTDITGQSILQNAPIRILLRQGEDLSPFKGALSLNDVELNRLRYLKQIKGEYSECLIKTPFSSHLGRLYPNESEYALSRTDNIREEMIQSLKESTPCA